MPPRISEHCQELGIKIGIKHSDCNICPRQLYGNVSYNLTIDENYIDLKKMHCITIGKSIEAVPDSPRASIDIYASIMNQRQTLNVCKNMLRTIRSKYQRMFDDQTIEEDVVKVSENSSKVTVRKDREYKPYVKLSAGRKKYRMREVKDLIIKIANPTSNDTEEHVNQCAHVLEDAVEATYQMKGSKVRSMNYANVDVDDCGVPSTAEGISLDKDLCQYLEMELSNAKYNKVRKLANKANQMMSSKHILNKNRSKQSYVGFNIKWEETKKDNNGKECTEEIENYGCKISYIEGIKSFVDRDLTNHDIDYKSDNRPIVIVNSADGAVHPVTRYCDRTTLTQSISLMTSNTIRNNNRNLAKPMNLLSIMSSNGKENIETLSKVFKDYFTEKGSIQQLEEVLGSKNITQIELHDVKFTHAMHCRNWNRSHYPFLGCYCQRGESFNEDHTCKLMSDEEHLFYYENAKQEWEDELRINPDSSIADHKDWCASNNFGVNNFGLHPKHLPLSNIRYDFGLHMPCAIARKILHWFRTYIDRHSNNDDVFMHFENLWENTYYSSQFKNGEVCSRIDGSHVKKFFERVNGLVDVINNAYASNTCIKNFTELLKLLPSLYAFWTEVTIESYDSYKEKIETYINNINLFYKYGRDTIFTNTYVGDGETFYLHCAKFHVPRIARDALEVLGCGVGIWTMQGFEHRNKESKCVYSNKTNGKGNCCKQVLKAMHRSFLNKQ